ncbi:MULTISPECIES: hypothetical protein [Polynucleobacter]|uniref:Uncharacterized protein n=1 Tax=Polynucleobacter campilacus TaxID=1743163 RepID=A0A254PUL1_9BURK|nr:MULTISPECIES: hypothetical protein [Polynucleobacter]MBU3555960.1 hypothetical protein [Polynucleobacter sp. UB-Piko-W3]OWS70229.1 hypothetical protein CBI31_07930 [Polynucleobacter campilacus]
MKQINKKASAPNNDLKTVKRLRALKTPKPSEGFIDDALLIQIARSRKGGLTVKVELEKL